MWINTYAHFIHIVIHIQELSTFYSHKILTFVTKFILGYFQHIKIFL
jgi:hypothetical protein